MNTYKTEACVENLDQVLKAAGQGADRVELCDRLDLDGTTPPKDLIRSAILKGGIPVRVMIRPRGGNFIYSEEEFQEMIGAIEFCKEAGAAGVVFGILKPGNELDLERISRLAAIAHPLEVTIHKAIDETADPVEWTKKLTKIAGVTAILTSGGKASAEEGKDVLKKMVEAAAGRLEIIPAGGITRNNVENLHIYVGAKAYHGKRIVGELQ